MKRFFFTVIATFICTLAFPQEHMKFKGFDIDGTTEEFANKLATVGFEIFRKNDKQIYGLKGEFAGYEATIILYPNSKGITYGVAVLYEVKNKPWEIIKTRYEKFERNLTIKYGEPIRNVKKMNPPYKDGSGYETLGFEQGKNEYGTAWVIDEVGAIVLTYEPPFIALRYKDTANSVEDEIQAFEDL